MKYLIILCVLLWPLAYAENVFDTLVASKDLSDGWKQSGPAKIYDKDNVFDLIDGEAEIYFPYGFTRVAAIDYERGADAGTAMACEVYEMGSLLNAFGIYSNYRDEKSKIVNVGTEGYAGSTESVFYQDRYFVKVRGQKPAAKEGDVLACAQAISAKLPQKRNKPDEVRLIQIPQVEAQAVKYIGESLLGYKFFPRGLIAQVKDSPTRVFVLLPKKEQKVERIVADYRQYLKENGVDLQDMKENTYFAMDPLHKGTLLSVVGERIVGVTELKEPEQGEPLLRALTEKAN